MKDYTPEKIKHLLKKIWFTELYLFVEDNLNDTTKEIMLDLLKFDSDLQTIQIINNTIGNELSRAKEKSERQKYINNIGYLMPDRARQLADSDDVRKLKEAVSPFPEYREMLEQVGDMDENGNEISSDSKSIDEVMKEARSLRYSKAFENQFHMAVFYAYLKLKELEIANLVWLAELVSLNIPKDRPGWKKFVVPFKYHFKDRAGNQN